MLPVASVVLLFIIFPRDCRCHSSLFTRRLPGDDNAETCSCVSYSELTTLLLCIGEVPGSHLSLRA